MGSGQKPVMQPTSSITPHNSSLPSAVPSPVCTSSVLISHSHLIIQGDAVADNAHRGFLQAIITLFILSTKYLFSILGLSFDKISREETCRLERSLFSILAWLLVALWSAQNGSGIRMRAAGSFDRIL